jgi:hypothetical protein
MSDVKKMYVHQDLQGLDIRNAVVNVFDTLADATAYATNQSYGAERNGQEITVLENPIEQNGNIRYRKYDWKDTEYILTNGTAGADEITFFFDPEPPITTFIGGDDTGIITGVAPTLPQGIKNGFWSADLGKPIHEYIISDAGLPTQTILEVNPPTLVYLNTTVETIADIATSTLGLRPNTKYVNTNKGIIIETDAAGLALIIEDGIFDFEFETDAIALAVGVTTIDINSAQVITKVPADLGNVEAFTAGLLAKAVEGSDSNNDDAKSTQSVNILPNSVTTFDVEVAVAGTYKFSAHLNVKKQ